MQRNLAHTVHGMRLHQSAASRKASRQGQQILVEALTDGPAASPTGSPCSMNMRTRDVCVVSPKAKSPRCLGMPHNARPPTGERWSSTHTSTAHAAGPRP